MVNTIGDKHFKALKRPDEGRKYNNNTLKNRNNRTKRLALLSGCPSRQPKMRIQLAKLDIKIYNTIIPFIY